MAGIFLKIAGFSKTVDGALLPAKPLQNPLSDRDEAIDWRGEMTAAVLREAGARAFSASGEALWQVRGKKTLRMMADVLAGREKAVMLPGGHTLRLGGINKRPLLIFAKKK
jgi:hypothetical protein